MILAYCTLSTSQLMFLLLHSRIYDFMGARHFGMVNNKQASVMTIAPVAESVDQAKCGGESFKAHRLSYQFKNLCRGQSFAVLQMAKWKDPQTGLKREELMIIESLAYDAMKFFGYEAKYVKKPCDGKNSLSGLFIYLPSLLTFHLHIFAST